MTQTKSLFDEANEAHELNDAPKSFFKSSLKVHTQFCNSQYWDNPNTIDSNTTIIELDLDCMTIFALLIWRKYGMQALKSNKIYSQINVAHNFRPCVAELVLQVLRRHLVSRRAIQLHLVEGFQRELIVQSDQVLFVLIKSREFYIKKQIKSKQVDPNKHYVLNYWKGA